MGYHDDLIYKIDGRTLDLNAQENPPTIIGIKFEQTDFLGHRLKLRQ